MTAEQYLIWGVCLLAASLLLVIIEVFVPSGGLLAVVSTGCAVTGVVFLFKVSTTWGLAGLGAMVVLGPSAFAFALKIWPSTPMGRRMLGAKSPEEEEADRLAALKEREKQLALIGAEGVVLSDLRPVGVIQIDGQRFDALSETGLIRAGSRIRVTKIDSNQVKVRAV